MIKKFNLFEEIFIRPKEIDPTKPSILYINGSRPLLKEDGSLNVNRRSQLIYNRLSQFGDNVIYPSVYWKGGEMIFDEMIEIVENKVNIVVTNPYSTEKTKRHQGHRIALDNIRQRLKAYYGDSVQFQTYAGQALFTTVLQYQYQ